MPIAVRVLMACLVVLAGVASGTTAASGLQPADPDTVLMDVGLEADGNATWAVSYRYRLDDNESETAFESLRADILNDSAAYEDRFADRMRLTLRDAENATGRRMALQNMTVTTKRVQLPQEYGVVVYRFTWTNFSAVDGDRIRAGDAVGGLFLTDGTSLSFTWVEGYHRRTVTPEPDRTRERTVTWTGPQDFEPGQPRIELQPGMPTAAGGAPGDDQTGFGTVVEWLGSLPPVAVGLGALVGIGAVLAFLVGWRESPAERAAGSELLTNEEQVLGLLEDRGGRTKQQELASSLDWTDAKTSKVVRQLREDDEVEVVRIGRENVVALPGELDT